MSNGQSQQDTASANNEKMTRLFLYVLAILLALTLNAAFDTFMGPIAKYNDFSQLWPSIGETKAKSAILLVQAAVFLLLVARFYPGAYCYYAVGPKKIGAKEIFVNMLGTVLLFGGFYASALTLRSTKLFYYVIMAFHALDFFWFWFANFLLGMEQRVRRVTNVWQFIDLVTIASILICRFVLPLPTEGPYYWFQWASLVVLILISLADFYMLWPFYKSEPEWETKLHLPRWMAAAA